jgi:hypothetical protein
MENELKKQQSDFMFYTSNDGQVSIDVMLKNETVWLPQKSISELFGAERSVISKHLNNIFISGELEEKSNVQKMHFSHSFSPKKILTSRRKPEAILR